MNKPKIDPQQRSAYISPEMNVYRVEISPLCAMSIECYTEEDLSEEW